jgi:hypothetical protein
MVAYSCRFNIKSVSNTLAPVNQRENACKDDIVLRETRGRSLQRNFISIAYQDSPTISGSNPPHYILIL